MAEQSTEYERSVPLALAEPSVHVTPGWIAGLGLANIGMWMAALTPAQVQAIIRQSCVDIGLPPTCAGAGLIDCIAAIKAA